MSEKREKREKEWLSGHSYRCLVSASPGYKQGKHYTAYTNAKGQVCLRGSDGYEDECSMLVSSFQRIHAPMEAPKE